MHTRLLLLTALGALASCATPAPPARAVSLHAAEVPTQARQTQVATQGEPWRALSRFGYGPAQQGVASAQTPPLGRDWALAELADAVQAAHQPARIPAQYSGFDAPLPTLFAEEKASQQARQQARREMATAASTTVPTNLVKAPRLFSQEIAPQAADWRLWSCGHPDEENPLLARMTEFWFNHLNVFVGKGPVRPFVGHYVLHAIRPYALGRFEDLLLASARHPAMLYYLDQVHSRAEGSAPAQAGKGAPGLNENYAREVMELHTLGVNSGYTQQDVRALARILTGWTVDPRSDTGFRFVPRWHDQGDKLFLGHHFAGGGEQEGVAALRLLARQPATARRISLRLAQWFVADQPPPALVERLTQRYLQTQGDIAAVMRTLIESPETWDPHHQLFKTPMDYACSILTALGPSAGEQQIKQAQNFLRSAGQPVHGWLTPDGYGTGAATWLSPEALSRRADFAMQAGRADSDVEALARWLPAETVARIAHEPVSQQAGLAFAGPTWMRK